MPEGGRSDGGGRSSGMPLLGKAAWLDVYGNRSFGSMPKCRRCRVNEESGGETVVGDDEDEVVVGSPLPPLPPPAEAKVRHKLWTTGGGCRGGLEPRITCRTAIFVCDPDHPPN